MMQWISDFGRKGTPPPQSFWVNGNSFRHFRDYVDLNEVVRIEFSARGPIDVFFVDDAGLTALREGKQFTYHGRLRFQSGTQGFYPRKEGYWNLVIGNRRQESTKIQLRIWKETANP